MVALFRSGSNVTAGTPRQAGGGTGFLGKVPLPLPVTSPTKGSAMARHPALMLALVDVAVVVLAIVAFRGG